MDGLALVAGPVRRALGILVGGAVLASLAVIGYTLVPLRDRAQRARRAGL